MNNQLNKDYEQLRILAIFHYVLAGIMVVPALFGLVYIAFGMIVGVALLNDPNVSHDGPPVAIVSGFFVVFGLVFAGVFIALGALVIKSGRNLTRGRGYTFSLVVACVICLWMPLGTILGVFTIVVLMRDSVKAMFNGTSVSNLGTPPDWR